MTEALDRRTFLKGSAVVAGGLTAAGGLTNLFTRAAQARPYGKRKDLLAPDNGGYGPLRPDPDGLLALPAGFSYVAFGRTGELMSDGTPTPAVHDGMAALPGPNRHTSRWCATTSRASGPRSPRRPTIRRPAAAPRTCSSTRGAGGW